MNIQAQLQEHFRAALTAIAENQLSDGELAELLGMIRREPRSEIRRLSGQLRDAAGKAIGTCAARRGRKAGRTVGRASRIAGHVPTAGNRWARLYQSAAARCLACGTVSPRGRGFAFGHRKSRRAEDLYRRLFLAKRRQADARRPCSLDRDRRCALSHAQISGSSGDWRQPSRRLGHAVRDDHLRLEALSR